MIVFSFILITATLFSFVAFRLRSTIILRGVFILLFLYLGIRYQFGIDYLSYMFIHQKISMGIEMKGLELGWVELNRLTSFFSLVLVLSLFYCITFYRLIKKYVTPEYWWFAVLILILNFNLLITHASAMRQTVAVLIFINSIEYILKRKPLIYFTLCLIATLFHKSAIILIPVYFVQYFNPKSKYIYWSIALGLFVFLIFNQNLLLNIFDAVLSNDSIDSYNHYVSDDLNNNLPYINILIYFSLFLIVAMYDKYNGSVQKTFTRIFLLSLYFIALSYTTEMIARLSYYFMPISLIIYPNILSKTPKAIYRILFITTVIIVLIKRFYEMMQNPLWNNTLINYYTIFES